MSFSGYLLQSLCVFFHGYNQIRKQPWMEPYLGISILCSTNDLCEAYMDLNMFTTYDC